MVYSIRVCVRDVGLYVLVDCWLGGKMGSWVWSWVGRGKKGILGMGWFNGTVGFVYGSAGLLVLCLCWVGLGLLFFLGSCSVLYGYWGGCAYFYVVLCCVV